jgi:hypothetical protein
MATQMMDIGLAEDADLRIASGDFDIDESTAVHQQQLILNNKGDFKQNPTICVGVFDYIDDEHFQELARAISIEFTRDGMEVKSIRISQAGIISSDAYYP